VPPDEWEALLTSLRTPLPSAFRVRGAAPPLLPPQPPHASVASAQPVCTVRCHDAPARPLRVGGGVVPVPGAGAAVIIQGPFFSLAAGSERFAAAIVAALEQALPPDARPDHPVRLPAGCFNPKDPLTAAPRIRLPFLHAGFSLRAAAGLIGGARGVAGRAAAAGGVAARGARVGDHAPP
jgi:hypothetical protein